MKKRNFLKVLSSAILGTLTIGNCSNVWMMEESEKCTDNKKCNAFYINIFSLLENLLYYKNFLIKQMFEFHTPESFSDAKNAALKKNPNLFNIDLVSYENGLYKKFSDIFKQYLKDACKEHPRQSKVELRFLNDLLSKCYNTSDENKSDIDHLIDVHYININKLNIEK